MEVSESNEDGLTADGMEVRKGNFMCTCCFMIYFFLLTVACLLFLGIGIFGVSYLPGLTTSNEEMDTMIADAQAHRSNFTEAAISVIDTYVINTATVNPTFWYDMQGLLGCCGYFNKNLTVPPAESDYSTNQNACIAASRDATATTTNAEGCAACVTDGNAQDECTTAQHYDQCGRLSAGCPMYNGAACFSADTENQACYNLVMDFLDNSGWQIGVVSLVLWFFSTIIEFSVRACVRVGTYYYSFLCVRDDAPPPRVRVVVSFSVVQ